MKPRRGFYVCGGFNIILEASGLKKFSTPRTPQAQRKL
jgi:hypothetical protein